MVQTLALTPFLGLPLVVYGGITTLLLMLFTATVGFLNFKGIHVIPFKWHPRLAVTTITVALIHAVFGLSIFLGF
jgi:cytochrome b561